jgi:DNA (cytosine-5)-methyltransferase 1
LRRRVFVIGSREGSPFCFPEATHHSQGEGKAAYRSAWDALHEVTAGVSPETRPKGKWADLLPTIPAGMNYLWHTDRGGGEPLFGWRRRYWSFLLKLAPDQPAWTIQAQPGPATGPFHWESRRLTIREMARLQTFPCDIQVTGSLADAQKQLGNAVPSLLSEILAREIAGQLLGQTRNWPLALAVRQAEVPPPTPPVAAPVPRKYLSLKGEHSAHPGRGQGARALRRKLVPAA